LTSTTTDCRAARTSDREIKEHLGRLDAADAAAMQAEADALAAGDRNRREEFNGDGP
jgi:hypothetical protein